MRNKIAEIGGKSARNRGFKTPHADANSRQDVYYILGTDYGHTMAISLILWSPNSNPNPQKIFGIGIL